MKPLTLIFVMLTLGSSGLVGAQQWEWNPDGTGQYGAYSGPGRPSIGSLKYEATRRQAESYETEANRWRLEALRQERERSSNSAKPVDPNPYNFPEAVYGPNGRMMLCTKGFPGQTYCN